MAVSGGDALRAVTLPAAGQREGTPVTVPLRVANRGGAPLALALALRARSENVLVRQRWLDAAGGPAPSLSRSSSGCSADKVHTLFHCHNLRHQIGFEEFMLHPLLLTVAFIQCCTQGSQHLEFRGLYLSLKSTRSWTAVTVDAGMAYPEQGGSGACAEFAAGAGGGVALLGGDGLQPLRYAQALQLPLRAQAALRRTRPCSDHVLALSSRPTAPRPGNLHPATLPWLDQLNKHPAVHAQAATCPAALQALTLSAAGALYHRVCWIIGAQGRRGPCGCARAAGGCCWTRQDRGMRQGAAAPGPRAWTLARRRWSWRCRGAPWRCGGTAAPG